MATRATKAGEAKTTEATPPEATSQQVAISRINTETLLVPVIGTAPLIVHRFSEKAKRTMLDAMQGRKSPKSAKDPESDYNESMYRLDNNQPGFPALAFKAATVGGARFFGKSVTMTSLRQSMFFDGELSKADGVKLVAITGEPGMREDVVRVGNGGTDLRYRAEFPEWSTTLTVIYVASMLTRDSVLSLIEAGGMGVGVGEWRPERRGDFGTFIVDPSREVEVL